MAIEAFNYLLKEQAFSQVEIIKIENILTKFKIFSRTTGPISTKFGTKHPWVKGIQIYSNEGPRPFQRADNYEIAKIH